MVVLFFHCVRFRNGTTDITTLGCFAQYCVTKGDLGVKIPDNMKDEEASTLGVGISTVGQGLYQSLGLPLPGSEKYGKYLLVYGGSTATGTLAVQFGVL